ncbi:hypothetical protein A3K73_06590 [Candidatus Pacearchaeota archaeon RBG_13_36_9]|nr:MAG: hypothetical protein A3K73_06590 [Candidatus Pacearchaeota archaeon RBG_13_36_9]
MNEKLLKEMDNAKGYLIIVEGKKDKWALEQLGFRNIFVIHETGKSLGEKIEQIQQICSKKDKACILTDFDKKGKQMYLLLKSKLNESGVRMYNTLRNSLLKERISHIEGLYKYMEKQEEKNETRRNNS